MQSFDIIIVGGGLVGAGLAVALKNTPLRIALVDARLPSSTDPRLFGLTESSIQFLKNLNVWDALAMQATKIQEVHVSQSGRYGGVRLHHQDVGLEALGYTIPACVLESVLNDALLQT